jgi:hypothetical protein
LRWPRRLLESYVQHAPAIRAQRVLDMSEAALYPILARYAKRAAQQWRREWTERARGAVRAATAIFTVNGRPVSVSGAKQWFRQMLGEQFSND